MTPGIARLDGAFSALADPTRRAIVERLAGGERTVGEITADRPVSAPAISKHLRALEASGLLQGRIEGRAHHLGGMKMLVHIAASRRWPGLSFVDTMIGLRGRPERMVPHGRPTAEIPA